MVVMNRWDCCLITRLLAEIEKTSHFNGMLKLQRVGAISLRPFSIGLASLSLFAQGNFLAHYIVLLTLNNSVRPLPSRKFVAQLNCIKVVSFVKQSTNEGVVVSFDLLLIQNMDGFIVSSYSHPPSGGSFSMNSLLFFVFILPCQIKWLYLKGISLEHIRC